MYSAMSSTAKRCACRKHVEVARHVRGARVAQLAVAIERLQHDGVELRRHRRGSTADGGGTVMVCTFCSVS